MKSRPIYLIKCTNLWFSEHNTVYNLYIVFEILCESEEQFKHIFKTLCQKYEIAFDEIKIDYLLGEMNRFTLVSCTTVLFNEGGIL